MKTLIPTIAILITLTGCKEVKLNKVSYLYAKCESIGNVGIKLDTDGVYRCIEPKHNVKSIFRKEPKTKKKIVKKKVKKIVKRKSVSKGCETTITEIFNSKEFKKPLVICKGKFLEKGQKTKIIRVNK